MHRVRVLALLVLVTASAPAAVVGGEPPETRQAKEYLKAFPEAGDGMIRYVVMLPEKPREQEADLRVELLIGKKMVTDGVNQVRMGGEVEEKTAQGWGFTYYEVAKFGAAASTLMAVPPGTPQVEKFVSIPTKLIPYNSRVPLVIYVPEGGEVRYRVWSASEETELAERG